MYLSRNQTTNMKKTIVFSLLLFPFFSFAQFNKGQVYLGGSLSTYEQNSSSGVRTGSTSITPVLGYFLKSNWALGASIGYSSSYSKNNLNNTIYNNDGISYALPGYVKTTTHSIAISPFVRYYIAISNSFYFAAQGQVNFLRGNNSYTNFNNGSLGEYTIKSPSYTLGAAIKPVLIFFPSSKWSVEASIGSISYNHFKNLPKGTFTNAFSLSGGSLSFGVAYYFKRE